MVSEEELPGLGWAGLTSPWELGLGLQGSRFMEEAQVGSRPLTDILPKSLEREGGERQGERGERTIIEVKMQSG